MVLSATNRVRAVLMQVAAMLVMLLFVWEIQAAETKKSAANSTWVTLNGCKFLPEDYNDGDSFHVKYGQREFIFRLYFVDTPEGEDTYVDRIKEQCDYFGVTREQHLKSGAAARALTAELLKRPCNYTLIEVGGQDLAALLVSRGLARAKGTVAVLPTGEKAKAQMAKLKKLEDDACAKRVGIWTKSTKAAISPPAIPPR